jgi:predicted aldo/keto reductase-like oxidoreductase
MVRLAHDNGVNCIDTAWSSHNEKSEEVVGRIHKDGYREQVYLPPLPRRIRFPRIFSVYNDDSMYENHNYASEAYKSVRRPAPKLRHPQLPKTLCQLLDHERQETLTPGSLSQFNLPKI